MTADRHLFHSRLNAEPQCRRYEAQRHLRDNPPSVLLAGAQSVDVMEIP